jgi:hypothetical protein
VVLVASAKVDEVLDMARREESHTQEDVDGHTIHSWSGDKPTYASVTAAPDHDRRVVVLAQR